eukprot:TRINITY_DN2501_c2_g1_i1.p1 TRINITY_DN2501_c2_g1~~TRINITY_DN2501_c2_g1_i1.p1  ORF type:complete len:304 (+),score=114.13 TRINITY_DN2501_c2_g1_i1:111-1022(+)
MPMRLRSGWANSIGYANEDRWIVHEDEDDWNIYSVMDGHGGVQAVTFVRAALTELLLEALREQDQDLLANDVDAFRDRFEKGITHLYQIVEDKVLALANDFSGVCVTAVAVSRQHPVGFVVHLGDCRVVLARGQDVPVAITEDHQMSNVDERERILAAGYQPYGNRVAGLEPTRTFGDADVKEKVPPGTVSCIPEVLTMRFSPPPAAHRKRGARQASLGGTPAAEAPPNAAAAAAAGDSSLLIIATDGVWGTIGDFNATVAARRAMSSGAAADPTAAAEAVATLARSKGSTDDIAAVVVLVQH